jgi:hypothetical protein
MKTSEPNCTLVSTHPQCRWWPVNLPPSNERLFIFEREKDANIVVCDAKYQEMDPAPYNRSREVFRSRQLDPKDPISLYWLSYAVTQRNPPKQWLVWTDYFYFGVDWTVDPSPRGDSDVSFSFTLRAIPVRKNPDRKGLLYYDKKSESVKAIYPIRGRECFLRKVYIKTTNYVLGLVPIIASVDLFGIDVLTGEEAYERYINA